MASFSMAFRTERFCKKAEIYNNRQITNGKRYFRTMTRLKVKSMWWAKELVISIKI